jgi:hypothetical protein
VPRIERRARLGTARSRACAGCRYSAVPDESGRGLGRQLAPGIVLSDQLDVAVFGASVRGLVFDPQVWKHDLAVHHVETVGLRKRDSVGVRRHICASVTAVQIALVVPLQLVIEGDPADARAFAFEPDGLVEEDAIQARVMRDLARLDDS